MDLNGRHGKVSWTLEYWESKSIRHNWANYGDEVDVIATVRCDTKLGTVNASFGHYFVVPEAGSDIETVSFGLSKALAIDEHQTVTPYIKSETYWATNDRGPKGGTYVTSGTSYSRQIRRLNVSVTGEIGRDIHGAFGFQKDWLYKADARLMINVGNWNFGPLLRYGGGFSDPGKPGTLSYGFTASRTFSLGRGGSK